MTKSTFLFSEFFLHLLFFLPCPYSFLTPPTLFFLIELTGKFIIQKSIKIIDIYPLILKIYIERITVSDITFRYENGCPQGLCKAKRLTYVTTSGGPIFADFGYSYVKTIAKSFYGIEETQSYRAMNLDVDMITAEELLTKATVLKIE